MGLNSPFCCTPTNQEPLQPKATPALYGCVDPLRRNRLTRRYPEDKRPCAELILADGIREVNARLFRLQDMESVALVIIRPLQQHDDLLPQHITQTGRQQPPDMGNIRLQEVAVCTVNCSVRNRRLINRQMDPLPNERFSAGNRWTFAQII